LDINSKTGVAEANAEGKAEVILNQHSNAASIVHISKVQSGIVDPTSSLAINKDSGSGTIKVRVKFFFQKGTEEIMPTIRDDDGMILVK